MQDRKSQDQRGASRRAQTASEPSLDRHRERLGLTRPPAPLAAAPAQAGPRTLAQLYGISGPGIFQAAPAAPDEHAQSDAPALPEREQPRAKPHPTDADDAPAPRR